MTEEVRRVNRVNSRSAVSIYCDASESQGLLLPPREEYLEVSYTYGDEGAALQDLHTPSPALRM